MKQTHYEGAIRPAAAAGMFYPADPAALRSAVDKLLADAGSSYPVGANARAYSAMPFARDASETRRRRPRR